MDNFLTEKYVERVGGIVVSIAAFQAIDPGSIPGRRIVPSFIFMLFLSGISHFLSRNSFCQTTCPRKKKVLTYRLESRIAL